MAKYCECGRAIVVLKRNGGGFISNSEHDQCRKCYESHRDSTRHHH